MLLVSDILTKRGDRIGDRKIKAISPRSADKIYELILQGPRGQRPRQGERQLPFVAEHGASFTAFIRINLIAPYRILGMA